MYVDPMTVTPQHKHRHKEARRRAYLNFARVGAALLSASILSGSAGLAQKAPLSLDPGKQPRSTPPPAPPAAPQPPKGAAPAPCAALPPLPLAEITQMVNAYFNGITSFSADFAQINADGRTFLGKLYVVRPGRLRFDYDPPSPLEIVSDGTTVAVRNTRLRSQQIYSIGQTPLKFLLKDPLNLAKDTKVLKGGRSCGTVTLVVEDQGTISGTSRIQLVFGGEPTVLKQWTITDPSGNDTLVQLSDVNTNVKLDQKLFKIDTTREIDPNSNR